MLFTDDTRASLEFTAALANTAAIAASAERDELATPADLRKLLEKWEYTGRHDGDEEERRGVIRVRSRIRILWTLPRDAAVDEVNTILEQARAVPRLVRHDSLDWHIHAVALDAPLPQRMIVEAAMAIVDVIRADQMDRLRTCDAEDCERVYVDLSKNGSRRYCSVRCGNRVAGRAFRSRVGAAPR